MTNDNNHAKEKVTRIALPVFKNINMYLKSAKIKYIYRYLYSLIIF